MQGLLRDWPDLDAQARREVLRSPVVVVEVARGGGGRASSLVRVSGAWER